MKLNADVLYYHLSQKYDVEYRKGSNSEEELGRPRYYSSEVADSGCRLLLPGSESPVGPGTYLCFQEPDLTVPESATLFLLRPCENSREVYNELQTIYD